MGAVKNHYFDEINAQPDPVFVMDEPIFAARQAIGGPGVFYRGTYHTPDECRRILNTFRLSATADDWFAPSAKRLADELESAMREAANEGAF